MARIAKTPFRHIAIPARGSVTALLSALLSAPLSALLSAPLSAPLSALLSAPLSAPLSARLSILLLAASFTMPLAQAQEWPTRPLRILVVAGPGGLPDIAARTIAAQLQRTLGQPVLVENRAGGAGNIATEAVAKAAPDGYTLLSTGSNQAVNQILIPKPGFDYEKDLAPIAMIGESNMLLIASPAFPANNVRELIALAKKQPGGVAMGVSVLGSPNHVGAELLSSMAGIEMNFIVYKGIGQTLPDLMSGNLQLSIGSFPGTIGQVRGGKVKGLAVTRLKREPQAPEIPTIDESGLPGFEMNTWVVLMATGGTPRSIIEKLGAEARKGLLQPEVKAALEKQGIEGSQMTPAETDAYIKAEVRKWTPVLKNAKLKAH